MIVVRFFASLREDLATEMVEFDAQPLTTVGDIVNALSSRGDLWRQALSSANLLVAVNHAHAEHSTPVNDGDEVAIFPPVTGG
ncbi:MAG TPA: molybdopterin converting factor subunit 1 [Pseudomonadales bacterium]|nr:molybdopterin converting factor subunit 1 [Pseudomonadales bacterium]